MEIRITPDSDIPTNYGVNLMVCNYEGVEGMILGGMLARVCNVGSNVKIFLDGRSLGVAEGIFR